MPQEPAHAAERSQDGEAKAASERAKNRMFVASVRRRGVGSPELSPQKVALLRNRRAHDAGLRSHAAPEGDGVRPAAQGIHVDLCTALRTHVGDSGGEKRHGNALTPNCRVHEEPSKRKPSAAATTRFEDEGEPNDVAIRPGRRAACGKPDRCPSLPRRQFRLQPGTRHPRPWLGIGMARQHQRAQAVEAGAGFQRPHRPGC